MELMEKLRGLVAVDPYTVMKLEEVKSLTNLHDQYMHEVYDLANGTGLAKFMNNSEKLLAIEDLNRHLINIKNDLDKILAELKEECERRGINVCA